MQGASPGDTLEPEPFLSWTTDILNQTLLANVLIVFKQKISSSRNSMSQFYPCTDSIPLKREFKKVRKSVTTPVDIIQNSAGV